MDDSIAFTQALDPRTTLGDFNTACWLPRLREGRCGDWSIRLLPVSAARGYWGRGYRTQGAITLIGPFADVGAAWMSLVPMEIESQEIGIAAAWGHTVVLGLGMGWCAANIARNPAVERVTVVDRDPDVIALIAALDVFAQLAPEERDKISIVRADARSWRPDERVDCLHVDLWPTFVGRDRWREVRQIHANIGANAVYFWGQELELWRLACRAQAEMRPLLDPGVVTGLIGQTGIPLLVDPRPGYAERIAEAAQWWAPREQRWWDR